MQWLLRAAIFAVFVGGFVLVMYPMSDTGWLAPDRAGCDWVVHRHIRATAYTRRPICRRDPDAPGGIHRPAIRNLRGKHHKKMRVQRSGHIINITSMAQAVTFPGINFYCGSKRALEVDLGSTVERGTRV